MQIFVAISGGYTNCAMPGWHVYEKLPIGQSVFLVLISYVYMDTNIWNRSLKGIKMLHVYGKILIQFEQGSKVMAILFSSELV